MSPKVLSSMELEADFEGEDVSSNDGLQELWPLGEIDKESEVPMLYCLDSSSCSFMACSLHRACWNLSGEWGCLGFCWFKFGEHG